MNEQRRKEIETVLGDLADLRSRVQAIHDDEQNAFESMPEGLQTSAQGQASEAAAAALDDALSAFDDVESSLSDAKV